MPMKATTAAKMYDSIPGKTFICDVSEVSGRGGGESRELRRDGEVRQPTGDQRGPKIPTV